LRPRKRPRRPPRQRSGPAGAGLLYFGSETQETGAGREIYVHTQHFCW